MIQKLAPQDDDSKLTSLKHPEKKSGEYNIMENDKAAPKFPTKFIVAILAFILIILISVFLAVQFIKTERQRGIQEWKSKLDIIVNTRHAAVDGWLEEQFSHLVELSHNASLQIYMTELLEQPGTVDSEDMTIAEAAYLRNLLVVSAEKKGFKSKVLGAKVNANVARTGLAGLALLDNNHKIIAATPAMPPIHGQLKDFIQEMKKGQREILDLHLGAAGTTTMGFAVPIFAVHGSKQSSDQVGVVVGIKEVGEELYSLLQQPGADESEEALLVRKSGNRVQYLSPLLDGSAPLKSDLMIDSPELAAAFVLSDPGSFSIRKDYRGKRVLVVSRGFATTPWGLMYKIDADVALAGSESRLNNLTVMLVLIVMAFAFILTAAWWFGTSRRAETAVEAFQAANRELAEQKNFLQLLTESLPNSLFIVTNDNRYQFANLATAKKAGIPVEDIPGKTLESVLGPHTAIRYTEQNKLALSTHQTVRDVFTEKGDDGERVLQSVHIPMSASENAERGVMVIIEDISEAVKEREQRERIQEQIKGVLVSLVDRRDPNAVDHSVFVKNIASSMAQQLDMPPREIETIKTAANLMNLGKLLVPREILSKTEPLTDKEVEQIHDSLDQTVSLLQEIDFDTPVADIINQVHESWDGNGRPGGLKGEEIYLASRILNVANAFVGMTSARAYRDGLDVDSALDILNDLSGKKLDRRVVAALTLFLEHKIGRKNWPDYVSDLGGSNWSLIIE